MGHREKGLNFVQKMRIILDSKSKTKAMRVHQIGK